MSTPISKETKERIETEEDFVNLKRFDYSLEKLLERYPDGCPKDRLVAQALGMKVSEVDALYGSIVKKLKTLMGVTE